MKASDLKDWMVIGGLGIAAYLIYKFWEKGEETANAAARLAREGAENTAAFAVSPLWYLWNRGKEILQNDVRSTGMIRLPTGERVSTNVMNAVSANRQFLNQAIYFTYQARRYKIIEHDANGDWVAVYA